MAGAFDAEIQISTAAATTNLRALNKEVASTNSMLRELDTALKNTQGDLTKTAQALSSIVASQRAAAKGAKELADAQVAQARAEGMAITNANKVAESNARVAESEARRQRSLVLTQQAIERKSAADARASAVAERAAAATARSNESLSDSRYLLYDVGATYGVLAAGMLALPAATTAVAVGYQKDFAQVARTTEGTVEQTAELRQALKDMATEIPVAFSELTKMASLGGQLGLDTDELDEFTEAVAKMVATTNLSVEEGGTLFGRLRDSFTDQGDGVEFFNKIGSAIADVGVSSVATETEIAALMNQIGSISASVGFTAQETVGLAGALASLRVRPELARGTLTAIFTDMNRAVETGGPKLNAYADLLGMTAQETSKLYKTDPAAFFDRFTLALSKANEAGKLTSALDGIGVKQRRDTAMLTKLAVGYDVYAQSMETANAAYADGTKLTEMAAPVFETVAAKLQTLASALKNLMESVGGEGLGIIGTVFDIVQGGVEGITKLVDTVPGLSKLLQLLLGFSAVAGVFLGLKAAQAFVLAGLVGFQQVAGRQVIASSMSLTGILRQLSITFLMMGGTSRKAATDLMTSRGAMTATAIAADRLAATNSRAAASFGGAALSRVRGFGSALLGMVGGPIGIAIAGLAALAIGMGGVKAKAEQAQQAVADAFSQGQAEGARALAEALSTKPEGFWDNFDNGFSTNGKSVADIAKDIGIGLDTLTQAAMGSAPAVAEVQAAMDRFSQSKGFADYQALKDARKVSMLPDTVGAANGMRQIEDALTSYKEKADATKQTSDEVGSALSKMGLDAEDGTEGIGTGTEAIDEMNSALKGLMESIFGVLNNEAALNSALSKLGESVHNSGDFGTGTEGGRDNIANLQSAFSAAQKNFMDLAIAGQLSTQEAAAQYAAFVDGLIQQVRDLGGDPAPVVDLANQTKAAFNNTLQSGMPSSVPVTVDATSAQAELDAIQAQYGTLDATVLVEEHGAQEAANRVVALQGVVGEVTGQVYTATVDADTSTANENIAGTRNYLGEALLNQVFRGVLDFDVSAAIHNLSNVQNFALSVAGVVANAMGVAKKSSNAAATTKRAGTMPASISAAKAPAPVAAPMPSAPAAATFKPATAALGSLADGYNKAADAANKAGGAGKKAGKDAKDAAEEAAKAVEDYANRLKTALSSAYEKQYGVAEATDAYHSQLNSITKKREDELKTLQDLLKTQKELNNARDEELVNARKAEIERDISLKYGEVDRAADYGNQAQTSRDNAAAKQAEIEANKQEYDSVRKGIDALTGYSQAAITNRENLRSLEQKMQDMVVAYAKTGASQQQVEDYTRRLSAQFNTQVGQLGFNRSAVSALQGDMNRYIETVKRVPYRVATEVSANTGGANGAMNDFGRNADWQARNREANITVNVRGGAREIPGYLYQGQQVWASLNPDGTANGRKFFNRGGLVGYNNGGLIPGKAPSDPREDNLLAQVNGKGLIKVRSREFIQPQEAVDFYGLDFMNKIRTMQLPRFNMGGQPVRGGSSAGAASTTQVVALTAETLTAIQRAGDRPIFLFADDVALASSVDRGNTVLAHRGSN